MKNKNQRGSVALAIVGVYLTVAFWGAAGLKMMDQPHTPKEVSPPRFVHKSPGFDWHHEKSLKDREKFFNNHRLVNGKWEAR